MKKRIKKKLNKKQVLIREKQFFRLDGIEKTFPGYYNKDFYLHVYVPYFSKETAEELIAVVKAIDDARDYQTKSGYDEETDSFFYDDLENGYGEGYFKGTDILTVDGKLHLYPVFDDWMWDIAD